MRECFGERLMPDTCQSHVLIQCNSKPGLVLMVRLNYLMVTRQKGRRESKNRASAAKVRLQCSNTTCNFNNNNDQIDLYKELMRPIHCVYQWFRKLPLVALEVLQVVLRVMCNFILYSFN